MGAGQVHALRPLSGAGPAIPVGPDAAGQADLLAVDRGQCRGPDLDHAGGLPPQLYIRGDFAKQIRKVLTQIGIEREPIGIALTELPMLRALQKEGIEVVDGQQAMLDVLEVKTADEIEFLKMACAMVDATYVDIARDPARHARERIGGDCP
jgi:hypothetical protein